MGTFESENNSVKQNNPSINKRSVMLVQLLTQWKINVTVPISLSFLQYGIVQLDLNNKKIVNK